MDEHLSSILPASAVLCVPAVIVNRELGRGSISKSGANRKSESGRSISYKNLISNEVSFVPYGFDFAASSESLNTCFVSFISKEAGFLNGLCIRKIRMVSTEATN